MWVDVGNVCLNVFALHKRMRPLVSVINYSLFAGEQILKGLTKELPRSTKEIVGVNKNTFSL